LPNQYFIGIDKIETRHEELVKIEHDIKLLTRQECDLLDSINQKSKFPENVSIGEKTFTTLRELQEHIDSERIRIEKQSIQDFNENIKNKDDFFYLQKDLRKETKKSLHYNVPTISLDRNQPIVEVESSVFNMSNSQGWTYDNFNAQQMDIVQTRSQFNEGSEILRNTGNENPETILVHNNQIRRTRAIAMHRHLFQAKVENIQQQMQVIADIIEQNNWENQQDNAKDRESLLEIQEKFQSLINQFEHARTELMLSRWNEDLIEVRKRFVQLSYAQNQLNTQLPVNLIIIGEKTFGFNREGILVAIFDRHENQMAIMYNNGQIRRIVCNNEKETTFEYEQGFLKKTIDFKGRITVSEVEAGRLASVTYPDGEKSLFN